MLLRNVHIWANLAQNLSAHCCRTSRHAGPLLPLLPLLPVLPTAAAAAAALLPLQNASIATDQLLTQLLTNYK